MRFVDSSKLICMPYRFFLCHTGNATLVAEIKGWLRMRGDFRNFVALSGVRGNRHRMSF